MREVALKEERGRERVEEGTEGERETAADAWEEAPVELIYSTLRVL